MTSQTRRKTIVRSKYTCCFVPFPTDTDCYGLFFGRVLGFFWFLSVTLDRTDLQLLSIQMILPKKKEKPFKTHFILECDLNMQRF